MSPAHIGNVPFHPQPVKLDWEQIGQSEWEFYERMPLEFEYFFLKQLMQPLLSSQGSFHVSAACVWAQGKQWKI